MTGSYALDGDPGAVRNSATRITEIADQSGRIIEDGVSTQNRLGATSRGLGAEAQYDAARTQLVAAEDQSEELRRGAGHIEVYGGELANAQQQVGYGDRINSWGDNVIEYYNTNLANRPLSPAWQAYAAGVRKLGHTVQERGRELMADGSRNLDVAATTLSNALLGAPVAAQTPSAIPPEHDVRNRPGGVEGRDFMELWDSILNDDFSDVGGSAISFTTLGTKLQGTIERRYGAAQAFNAHELGEFNLEFAEGSLALRHAALVHRSDLADYQNQRSAEAAQLGRDAALRADEYSDATVDLEAKKSRLEELKRLDASSQAAYVEAQENRQERIRTSALTDAGAELARRNAAEGGDLEFGRLVNEKINGPEKLSPANAVRDVIAENPQYGEKWVPAGQIQADFGSEIPLPPSPPDRSEDIASAEADVASASARQKEALAALEATPQLGAAEIPPWNPPSKPDIEFNRDSIETADESKEAIKKDVEFQGAVSAAGAVPAWWAHRQELGEWKRSREAYIDGELANYDADRKAMEEAGRRAVTKDGWAKEDEGKPWWQRLNPFGGGEATSNADRIRKRAEWATDDYFARGDARDRFEEQADEIYGSSKPASFKDWAADKTFESPGQIAANYIAYEKYLKDMYDVRLKQDEQLLRNAVVTESNYDMLDRELRSSHRLSQESADAQTGVVNQGIDQTVALAKDATADQEQINARAEQWRNQDQSANLQYTNDLNEWSRQADYTVGNHTNYESELPRNLALTVESLPAPAQSIAQDVYDANHSQGQDIVLDKMERRFLEAEAAGDIAPGTWAQWKSRAMTPR